MGTDGSSIGQSFSAKNELVFLIAKVFVKCHDTQCVRVRIFFEVDFFFGHCSSLVFVWLIPATVIHIILNRVYFTNH